MSDKKPRRPAARNLFPIVAGGVAVFFMMVSMVVAAPFIFMNNTPPSYRAVNYTAQELQGRDLYLTLGCFYCHSSFVRSYDWGIGNTSLAGDFAFDENAALGTERTGPDLGQIGGQRPTVWHKLHDTDPRSVSPGSIMPNFAFLTDDQLNALIAFVQTLGTENLDTNNYKPAVPPEFANLTNPYASLMGYVAANYDPDTQTYSGNITAGLMWGNIFDSGKEIFTKDCLSCHGCSGNSQGPYARHVVTNPANINERLTNSPGDFYEYWRVSQGVPGTAMPAWGLSLNDTQLWLVITYEDSFVNGSIRTIDGSISDDAGDYFGLHNLTTPPINGTSEDFIQGQDLFMLYCAQCHGATGQGNGPASILTPGGYIQPEPANFTESGSDFQVYGRYVYKVMEGVETTNMPPWKYSLSQQEIYQAVFFVQGFSSADDYNSKWGPLYNDSFARNLKGGLNSTALMSSPAAVNAAGVSSLLGFSLVPAIIATVATGCILWEAGSAHTGKQKLPNQKKKYFEGGFA